MRREQEEDEVGLGLKIFAAFFVLAMGLFCWALVTTFTGPEEPDELAHLDPEERREERRRRWRRSEAHTAPAYQPVELSSDPDQNLAQEDPQMFASLHRGRRADAGVFTFPPQLHLGRVTTNVGDAPVQEGASCDVRVLPVAAGRFNCLVRVMCEGVVIYPDQAQYAGYAPCDIQNGNLRGATDDGVTSRDGDPAVKVDLRNGRVVISDNGPGVPTFSTTVALRGVRI